MVDWNTVQSEPPEGCADPTVWQLAYALYRAHATAGVCGCGEPAPCAGHALARDGLATALGQQVDASGYWRALAGVRSSINMRIAS
jgi:hypothetical protein